MDGEEESGAVSGVRKTFWRSASWSASHHHGRDFAGGDASVPERISGGGSGQVRRCPAPPLTPRSKSRSCLPPLQPLSITRRNLDEWPSAGSDDVGEWPHHPPTPGAAKPGDGLKLDLSSLQSHGKKNQIAFFDKECSKVADHIYLGGDSVARNREILRQNGITHVLNCVGFVCPEYFKADLVYKTLWLQDSPTEDITSILYDVFDYFEDVRELKGRVLVHCCQGVSRSTSLVIAYLMWREGQSFDDAFQFVKAARGIANPNMGFACQLLQCQKRVNAIPLSPNSVLRMYRMAPHSPYDPLHLVPKMLNDPSPAALDSRGAFILHVISSIYVWIGRNCEPVMEKDAKAAAFQVVRYERVSGSVVTVVEGREPLDFWDAFSNAPLSLDTVAKVNKEEIKLAIGFDSGKRKVEAYDVDFELFHKAITGGVVPPFPSSGPGHETHLPARGSNWSMLRRKFISGTFCRVNSDSALIRDADPRANRVQHLIAAPSGSPPYLSPGSLSSDSSGSSKCSLDSPSFSPSTFSTSSLTRPPASSSLPDSLLLSSSHGPHRSSKFEPLKPCLEAVLSPSKGFSRSIAERRGNFSPLKLPTLTTDTPLLSTDVVNGSSPVHEWPLESLERSDSNHFPNKNALDNVSSVESVRDFKSVGELTDGSSENFVDPLKLCRTITSQLIPSSTGSNDASSDFPSPTHPLIYRYPEMKNLVTVRREDLDPKAVFLFLTRNKGKHGGLGRILYLWIGRGFEHDNCLTQLKSGGDPDKIDEFDWKGVGCDFLALMGLPKDIPIEVVKEQEPEEFLQVLNST